MLFLLYGKMKRKILYVLLFLQSLASIAVPVERVRTLLHLTDGTEVMATAFGDELFSFFVADDGRVIELTDEGFTVVCESMDQYLPVIERKRVYVRRKVGLANTALIRQHGVKRIPVILACFSDLDFSVASDSASVNRYYDLYCNGENYTGHGSTGSVRDYFVAHSKGDFLPEFKVLGPYRLPKEYYYYGKDQNGSKDVNYSEFLRECMKSAVADSTDWSQFDNDGNGTVDLAMVIFAGMGQNYTNGLGITGTIWPKEMPTSFTESGVRLAGCSSCSELRPRTVIDGVVKSKSIDGVGTFMHEMCHALGLPDLYDTNYRAFGMDYWSLMDMGNYVNGGKSPVTMTAYERDFMGWQPLQVLDEPCTLHIPSFDKGGCGYKIVNDANPNEYYVLENRQSTGWDDKLCGKYGSGLMVTHVDYLQSAWTGNRVNADYNHQRLTIIPANNRLIGSNNKKSNDEYDESMQGNLYPGSADNHELTDESVPASVVYQGGKMGKPIYDIDMREDGIITLKYRPLGILPEPKGLLGAEVSDYEAMLEWDEVENAQWYNVQVFAEYDDEPVFALDSIPTNSCEVKDLEPGKGYRFCVQATADKWRNSQWTESDIFHTTEDFVSDIEKSSSIVRVFSLSGMMVTECREDELSRLSLRRGVYIMKDNRNNTKKIYL